MATTGEQSVTREALTPAYASPESFRAEEPTAAGDVYSLTATLYGLLSGRPRVGAARQIPKREWEISVMPPDQDAFDSGAHAYRCVAHRISGPTPRTAQFGP